jgi:peptide/nickel transport system ATP-binding protein/oligopeptide transport system ATP-binding protein
LSLPANPLLVVEELTIEFAAENGGWVPVVERISFRVDRGEVVALVGESGSGKTVTSLALLGLLGARNGRVARGSILFDGLELVGLTGVAWRRIRGKRVGMIFQDPIGALNPAFTVGDQIAETVRTHTGVSRRKAWTHAVEMLRRVRIPNPERRAHDYPHMLSGGMCQRVMIAQALACAPDLLIADEPTTALDMTIQAAILRLVRQIQLETGISLLLITHDLGVVAELADRVIVLYAGQVVESGSAADVLTRPVHPYTEALLGAIPKGNTRTLVTVPGMAPNPGQISVGCRFAPRCRYALPLCRSRDPELQALGNGRASRCLRVDDLYAFATSQGAQM